MHCFCDNEWFLIKNYLDYSDIFERWKCEENILQTLTYEETKALAFFLIRWDYWCSGIYDELLSGGDFIPVVERLDEFRKTFEEKK
ncbi:MAG TPA: hypothetical protein O0X39_04980 [Methanocorpusculum sp.]|nr:hypothetical protein [Methanocorpusculum sp.]